MVEVEKWMLLETWHERGCAASGIDSKYINHNAKVLLDTPFRLR